MNWLDILIIITLVIGGLLGYRTGVIKAVFGIVGGVLGVFLAGRFSAAVGTNLDFISNESVAKVAGFVIVFAIVMAGAIFAANVLRKALKLILLGWVDSFGGAALAALLGGLVWVGLIGLLGSVSIGGLDNSVRESTVAEALSDNLSFVLNLLPEEYRHFIPGGGGDDPGAADGGVSLIPSATIKSANIEEVTSEGMTVLMVLAVNNPTPLAVNVESLEFRVFTVSEDQRLFLGRGEARDLQIGGRGVTDVDLVLSLSGSGAMIAAGPVIVGLLAGDPVRVSVEGTMGISLPVTGSVEIPFSGEHTVRAP